MTLYVLDDAYNPIYVVDSFTSLIWTTCYYDCGDFELYLKLTEDALNALQPDYFIVRDDDSSVMVIESLDTVTDAETGDYLIIKGRCLKSILLRRIFDRQFFLNNRTTINDLAAAMIDECTSVHYSTHHDRTYRLIPGLTVDTDVTFEAVVQVQFTGQTLFNGIMSVAQSLGIGLKMSLSGSDLILSFFKGNDNGIEFSPEFDNLLSSKYSYDKSNYYNQARIAGEGEGENRRWMTVLLTTLNDRPRGLELRELFVDARDISSNDGEISYDDYNEMLYQRGKEKLTEKKIQESFDSEVEPRLTYVYKRDYNLGDIVTVNNGYGVSKKSMISEIVESWDDSGYRVIPKFDSIEDTTKVRRIILRDSESYVLKDSAGNILTVKG